MFPEDAALLNLFRLLAFLSPSPVDSCLHKDFTMCIPLSLRSHARGCRHIYDITVVTLLSGRCLTACSVQTLVLTPLSVPADVFLNPYGLDIGFKRRSSAVLSRTSCSNCCSGPGRWRKTWRRCVTRGRSRTWASSTKL